MRVLVVRTDFIGDAILTNCIIQSLKELHCTIDVLATKYNQVAFEYNPNISNKFFITHRGDNKVVSSDFEKVFDFSIYYDIILLCNKDFRTYRYIDKINATKVFAFRLGRKKFIANLFCIVRKFGTRYTFLEYDPTLHEVVNLYNLFNLAFNTQLQPLKISRFFVPDTIKKYEINNINNTIVINISGRAEHGKYLENKTVIDIINQSPEDFEFILLHVESDKQRVQQIVERCARKYSVSLFSGSIYQVARVIENAVCYVGTDGGLTHLAAGLNCYVIGIYNPHKIKTWYPWTDKKSLICSPDDNVNNINVSQIVHQIKLVVNKKAV